MPSVPIFGSVGLRAVNNPEDVFQVKVRLIELGFAWLQADETAGPETMTVIKLFQAIKNGFQRIDDIRNDGRVDPNGETHLWLQASNAPSWILMPAGSLEEGFINTEIADTSDNHDFGTNWLSDTIRAAGAHYRVNYMDANPSAPPITINDASKPRGGFTPIHQGHQAGLSCDVRLPHKSGLVGGGITYKDARYDRTAMRAVIKAFRKQRLAIRVFFNDPQLVKERLCQAVSGHDNHAHFEVAPPARFNDF